MILSTNKLLVKHTLFNILATLLISIFIIADFSSYPIHDTKDFLHTGGQCLAISFLLFIFISGISFSKYMFAVIYPILTLVCSILGYYAWTLNTTFTVMILDATLNNDWKTSSDLISSSFILTILISTLLAIILVYYRFKKLDNIKHGWMFQLPLLVICLIIVNFTPARRVFASHLPFNIYYVTSAYIEDKEAISENRESLAKGVECNSDSLTVVFVIGESLRADHLQLNGYHRNTTPKLSKIENLISFPNIYTKQTYTNISIPFILTRADSLNPDRAYNERSFVDIFNACGFKTSWLANQEPANTYTYFMHECDTLIFATLSKSTYTFDKWLDEDLLPDYQTALKENNPKKLIILHTIGSHWWYNSHFTDKYAQYQPVLKSKIVNSNTREEIINAYDNTILYTDNFLSEVINELKDKNAVLFYLSDHGESFGENGVWLHAADSPPIHYPAGLIWLSDKYIQKHPERLTSVQANAKKRLTESYLFHSIIDAASISSPILQKELSIFNK